MISLHTVVSVSFEEAIYFLPEEDPSAVPVCLNLTGVTERVVELTTITTELTALSKSFKISNLCVPDL